MDHILLVWFKCNTKTVLWIVSNIKSSNLKHFRVNWQTQSTQSYSQYLLCFWQCEYFTWVTILTFRFQSPDFRNSLHISDSVLLEYSMHFLYSAVWHGQFLSSFKRQNKTHWISLLACSPSTGLNKIVVVVFIPQCITVYWFVSSTKKGKWRINIW